MSRMEIWRLEHGKADAEPKTLLKIAKALDASVEELTTEPDGQDTEEKQEGEPLLA